MTRSRAIRSCVTEARSTIDGELVSTSRVVDVLLDLRQLWSESPPLVDLVDSMLASLPGRSVVTNEWWTAQLDVLEAQLADDADASPAIAAGRS